MRTNKNFKFLGEGQKTFSFVYTIACDKRNYYRLHSTMMHARTKIRARAHINLL